MAGTMTQELDEKAGRARRLARQGARGGRAYPPARGAGAGARPAARAQHQQGDAGLAGPQRQAARGGEIERLRLAPGFQDHRAERRAACRIVRRPQRRLGAGRPHQQQPRRVDPQRK